jgi:hypothetical protein
MKELFRVLRQKELDVERVRKEIAALHFVTLLLAEKADWIENGLAPPRRRATVNPKWLALRRRGVVSIACAGILVPNGQRRARCSLYINSSMKARVTSPGIRMSAYASGPTSSTGSAP